MKQTLCCSTHSVQEVEKCCVDAVLISPNLPKFVDSECRKIPVSVCLYFFQPEQNGPINILRHFNGTDSVNKSCFANVSGVLFRAVITRVSLYNSDI